MAFLRRMHIDTYFSIVNIFGHFPLIFLQNFIYPPPFPKKFTPNHKTTPKTELKRHSEGESDISNLLLLHAQNVQNAIEAVEIWVACLKANKNQGNPSYPPQSYPPQE